MVPVTRASSYLPDLCLENIFMRVPLVDLLCSVRVICSNWRRVVPTDLRRRHSLVIVQEEDSEKIRKSVNLLPVPGSVLTKAFTTALISTLPSITHLTLVHGDIPRNKRKLLKQLARLINHYGNGLVWLKVEIDVEYREDLLPNFNKLIESVNQLESLRHLTLNVNLPDQTLTVDLSILSQLDTFASNISSSLLMDSYRQYATGSVRIVDCKLNLSLREMLQLDQKLASKFPQAVLSTRVRVRHFDEMRLFSERFTSISRLVHLKCTMPMTMLVRCLSPLTQLDILSIYLLRLTEEVPQLEFEQVPSVRVLAFIDTPIRSHLDTERLHVAQLFPNLKALSFCQKNLICDECEYEFDETDYLVPALDQIEKCLHVARKPFRQCAKLQSILFTSVDDNSTPIYITQHDYSK